MGEITKIRLCKCRPTFQR